MSELIECKVCKWKSYDGNAHYSTCPILRDPKPQAPGARERWIYNNSLGAAFVFKEKQSLPNLHGEFHVIEYAVYEATYQENVSLKTRISDMSAAHEALERELAAVNAAHDELLSYLPKVPTEPYEKELAQQLTQARTELAKFVKFDAFLKDVPVSVSFSQFSLKQRLQVMWFIFMGRTIDFQPVKSRTDMGISL